MKTYIVDSFTDKPFSGNPAGICIVDTDVTDSEMLQIAQELGLSETAFISPPEKSEKFPIRFFSPVMEIPLCGHATLASAKVMFETRNLDAITFINIQKLELIARAKNNEIVMEFPVYETHRTTAAPALLEALGLMSVENAAYNKETNILLLEIADPLLLRRLKPDFSALVKAHDTINGVLVTAPSGNDSYDFHSRYFWPWSGTNEDPVTGGTHTFLAKFWAAKLGKTRMRSFQSSKRGGFMQVELLGDKLLITSQAQIILQGELRI